MSRIVPYLGYGTPERLLVLARAVRGSGPRTPGPSDSAWRNALNMLRRLRPDPIPRARVRAAVGATSFDLAADEEGFVRAWVALPTPLRAGGLVPITFALLDAVDEAPSAPIVQATGESLVPHHEAELGVISDIDDTIIQSHVTDFVRAARTVLLGNARTRLPFPGVAAFYRALGGGGTAGNPIFFVSSSPWNLHDVIAEFMTLQGIPAGPLLLRDWDLGLSLVRRSGHHGHKGAQVREILAAYPTLPFILIGDSGEQDPEIYREVVRDHPDRILAVYIRDVTPDPARDAAIGALVEEVHKAGSTLILAEHTLAAAQHAAAQGWIEASALEEVEGDRASDEGRAPGKVATPG